MQVLSSINWKRLLYPLLMLGGMALGFGKWIVFSWMLQPSEFGTYTSIITSIAFLAYFGLFGLNEYIIKEGANLAGRGDCAGVHAIRDDILFISFLNSLLIICVGLLLLHSLSGIRFQFEQYFFISGILLVTVTFNAADASLRASLRSLPFAAMVFIRSVLLLTFGFLLAESYGLSGVLLAELISATMALTFAFYIAGPSPRFSLLFLPMPRIIQYLKYGFSFLGLQVFRYFSFVVDKWIVGWFAGAAALGYYSFLSITFLAFIGFAGIYNAVIIPRVISRFSANPNAKHLFETTAQQARIFFVYSVLFSPVYLGIAYLTIEYLLPQYYFDGIVLSLAAIYFGSVMHVSHGFFDSFFYPLNRQYELTLISLCTLIVFIGMYLAAGVLKADIFSFCIAFLVAKIILFSLTLWRVLVGHRNINNRIEN
jgi:O-antigen/teichoic acid export membrane protein